MGTTNVNRSFQILTLTLSHPPPTNMSLGVWIWTSAHSHRERGWIQDYLIFTSHHGRCSDCRLNLLNLQVCNYRCECNRCRIRVRVTHRSWFTWSSSWRNVAGSSRRMIRENTEFPLDAMWNKKATFPQSYADLADFRRSVRERSGKCSRIPFPLALDYLPRRRF